MNCVWPHFSITSIPKFNPLVRLWNTSSGCITLRVTCKPSEYRILGNMSQRCVKTQTAMVSLNSRDLGVGTAWMSSLFLIIVWNKHS